MHVAKMTSKLDMESLLSNSRPVHYAWNDNCDGLLAFDDIDPQLSVLHDTSIIVETQRQFATASCSTPIQRFADSDYNRIVCQDAGIQRQSVELDDTFPLIPTLDDAEYEDSMSHVAPRSTVILSFQYTNLDTVDDHATFCTLDDNIDLQLLYGRMLTPADVTPEEQCVSWQQMLADVSSAIRQDQEQKPLRDEQHQRVEQKDSIITL